MCLNINKYQIIFLGIFKVYLLLFMSLDIKIIDAGS